MKYFTRLVIISLSIAIFSPSKIKAQDTIHVQCFTYGSSQDSMFVFPSDTIRFRKILMNYKLRCPYTSQCGEWDYLTYTYLYKPTGMLDSISHSNPTFTVNGASIDTFPFMYSPSYKYHPYFELFSNHQNTISFDSAIVASNSISMNHPLNAAFPVCRSQYLWNANELATAGLVAGDISGIRLNILSAGSALSHLVIRVKASSLDSINTASYENSGFTTVYDRTVTFSSAGWTPIEFTNSFNWNGTTNLVFDISFSNTDTGTATVIAGNNSGFSSGITTACIDRSIFFEGADNISVPSQVFNSVDSEITISFWAYGNPAYLPQNQSVFEGTDSLGQRVLNCHLPWSDGIVYWDAGNTGTATYDRLSKVCSPSLYEGVWTHWAFVKNVALAKMKIYQNGASFNQTFVKHKLMTGIKNFKIGSFADGTNNYDGYIDDFEVFNKEVDAATINAWMHKKIDSTHPFYSNLIFSYNFDQPSVTSAYDSSGANENGHLSGIPVSRLFTPTTVFKNLMNTSQRPDVIFEQGVYTYSIDSVLRVDYTQNDPLQVIYYSDNLNPTVPTDTEIVYPAYRTYHYAANGNVIDSTLITPDSTLYLDPRIYWDPPFVVNDRFEIGRYITPYGNSLDLGNGFTWIYDVSDYRTLLHDTVHLSAGNNQELLDLSFDMIKGIPPRDPMSVQNIYPGGDFNYGNVNDPIENHFPAKYVQLDSAVNTRIKYRSTGHGEDGNNCDEFCQKTQSIKVNGVQRFNQLVWKDDCALNPLYPQGGTWPIQRANWCPGDDVPTYDYELTPYINSGDDSVQIDVNFQPYTMVISTSDNSQPHCVVETQLVKYRAPNFTLDAAIDDIKTPSNKQIYQRHNPICNNPLITIQNTGTTPLTSLTITYGQAGGTQSTYNWTGNLSFLQKTDVQLGNMLWNGSGNIFTATVSNPNGGTDQYEGNNTMTSVFTIPPQLDNALIFELKTNNDASENAYTIKDDQGNIVWSRSGLSPNVTYSDTLYLPSGCFEFRLTDSGEDGLNWWANPSGGAGTMKIKKVSDGTTIENFGTDFGSEIYFQFTVGYLVGIKNVDAINNDVHIYPNPTTGKINFDLSFSKRQEALIEIFSITGTKIFSEKTGNIISKNVSADLSSQPAGIYLVNVNTAERVYHSRIVLTK